MGRWGIVLLGPSGKIVEQVLLSYPARGAKKMGLSDLDSSLSLMESLDLGPCFLELPAPNTLAVSRDVGAE